MPELTTPAAVLLALAGGTALVDWLAVATARRSVELVSKPTVMVLLLGAALVLEPASSTQRWLFIAALALSGAGDVALLAPSRWFSMGLGAFLLAHVAYIAGLLAVAGNGDSVAAGVVFVLLADLFLGVPIVRGAAERRGTILAGAVAAYLLAISTTVVVAGASDLTLARIGAVALYASDGILGWNRFVAPLRNGRLLTRMPYHLGQVLMVLSLAYSG